MMGFLDAILGRSKPVRPNLDVLFAVPAASLTMQVDLELVPTGTGAVCFSSTEGQQGAQADAMALLSSGAAVSHDEYGYTWVTVHRSDHDLPALVTDLHVVNTTLADAGYGPSLLCTVVDFAGRVDDQPRHVGLVYLFKRGTFYPFVPTTGQRRDNTLEMRVRAKVAGELPVETDLSRWFPVWNNPAMSGS